MTVIVTGASRGIGRAIADRLYSLGHDVIGIAIKNVRDDDYVFPKYKIEQCDVSKIESVRLFYEKIKDKKITGLVNCAGIMEPLPISSQPYEKYEKVIGINLIGTMNTCSVFLDLMDKNTHTPIINMSSIAAHVPNSNTSYTASKFGIEGFTSSLAKELYKTKIRPNAICPGLVNTDMSRVVFATNPHLQYYIATQPIGIEVTPSDIADIVELLFDPKSNCIGGQSIQIG
jgi:3-oxoacyl-[acyl-carrier protein] reductase